MLLSRDGFETQARHGSISGRPLKSLSAVVLAAFVALAAPALAKGDLAPALGAARLPAISETDNLAERALARQIEAMIQMRVAMAEKASPRPLASETDPLVMSRHLAALTEVNDFSEQTVLGLVAATADDDARRRLAAALAPVVAKHERSIAAAFHALGALPLGRDNSLLKRAEIADQTSQLRVLAMLRAIADQHESRLEP